MDQSTASEIEKGEEHVQVDDEEKQADATVSNRNHGRCFAWMMHHHLGWLARIPEQWPRTCSLVFGVVIPLFTLIAVSLFFGYGLANLEAPGEIDANNEILANRALIATGVRFHGNVTKELPRMCLELFAQYSEDVNIFVILQEELDEIFLRVLDRTDPNEGLSTDNNTDLNQVRLSNTTEELVTFMTGCGEIGYQIANKFTTVQVDQQLVGDDLSFNWIRCDGLGKNKSSTLGHQLWGRPYADRSLLQPDAQAAGAISTWRREMNALYDETLEELLSRNETSPADARIQAYEYSVQNANGFDHCYANSAAGAWFWFTVMTTIGYGNTAPSTQGGRAMIYTLGFLSILLFAVILGTAGTIVVTIWDDFINRTQLHHFNKPWVACIFWGGCYYAWMLVIAMVTQNWKKDRLNEDVLFSEAYWFGYISTTTVGLGDYFLEHEVILREDLLVFPIMFLAGFVLLANFFVKLSEIIGSLIPRNRPTLEQTLAESDAPCLPKMPRDRLKEIHMRQIERLKGLHLPLSLRKAIQKETGDDYSEIHVGNNDEGITTAVAAEATNKAVENASPRT